MNSKDGPDQMGRTGGRDGWEWDGSITNELTLIDQAPEVRFCVFFACHRFFYGETLGNQRKSDKTYFIWNGQTPKSEHDQEMHYGLDMG